MGTAQMESLLAKYRSTTANTLQTQLAATEAELKATKAQLFETQAELETTRAQSHAQEEHASAERQAAQQDNNLFIEACDKLVETWQKTADSNIQLEEKLNAAHRKHQLLRIVFQKYKSKLGDDIAGLRRQLRAAVQRTDESRKHANTLYKLFCDELDIIYAERSGQREEIRKGMYESFGKHLELGTSM
ncbi:hypothetical protein NX059_007382 [Plenodomus lindquistii]|nr:hypothetical protein NX059_007382 [Plenodomus lindquistii]